MSDQLYKQLKDDLYLFNSGELYQSYRLLGNQKLTGKGETGYRFAVWAPNARAVYLVGDFNDWQPEPMSLLEETGVWALVQPQAAENDCYKYAIEDHNGHWEYKIDPYAKKFEVPPKDASVVYDLAPFKWRDGLWQYHLNDGLMTGIFLDQHEVRKSLVEGLVKDKEVLNMFSYTAAFSVAAAIGGAKATTSVDLAKRSRILSEAHFKANQLDLAAHKLIVMDVFAYFKYAQRHGLTYEAIILDPPSFARNKKQTFSVLKDYHKLVEQSLTILRPGGILITSTNAANLSIEKFKQEIEKGLASRPHKYLSTYRLPEDFQFNKKDERSNYLKVFTIRV